MKSLMNLLKGIKVEKIYGDEKTKPSGVFDDSRKVEKGGLFVAVKGFTVDGHDYIADAIEKGVVAVVGENTPRKDWIKKTTYIKVDNSRNVIGQIAANWFDNPSSKMHVIGVTGTDGKTTTASMIYHILKNSGKRVGLLTTVSAKIDDKEIDTGLHITNPEPIPLQKYLSEMLKKRLNYAVLEVTSHGLSQGRVSGINFETAVLTNITHEHLDYHKTKESYFQDKLKLFLMARNYAILNNGDPSSKKISERLGKEVDIITYGTKVNSAVLGYDYRREGKYYVFGVSYENKNLQFKLRIPGKFNMENALAAISTGLVYGVSLEKSSHYLRSFSGVRGRMHEIKNKRGIKIYIDFAHTPNALERVLKFLKRHKKGRLIAVFGCAGERDIQKRRMMPKISVEYADVSVFTAEDPRSEKIEDILDTMKKAAGNSGGNQYTKKQKYEKHLFIGILDRGEAISYAINKIAKKGDTLGIFGKGHEKSMAYNGVEYPWSDFDAVKTALDGRIKKIRRK